MDLIKQHWLEMFQQTSGGPDWWQRKQALWKQRDAKIVKISANGHHYRTIRYDQHKIYHYFIHLKFLTKQNDQFIREEQIIPYQFEKQKGDIINHEYVARPSEDITETQTLSPEKISSFADERFTYDRQGAVQYAELWWNSYNPAYRNFAVNCTNFVSQCLFAGGAPMRGAPNRNQGWWYQHDNWSYSWAVAHSLRWYLSGSTQGLKGREVSSPQELSPGDVICYDFQGDGRWDHQTIVVTKDAQGMPLVNAHTDHSRHRYWSYEDSTAWTPNIQYKFFRIGDS